ncbi:MAG: hypothetical protein DMF67_12765 [Acidobacteria bacterium]|nr:MAG: hypothetical protein DMF67_12765 [Acidobacteriota bacterium]
MNQSFKSAIRNPNSAISPSALARRAREFAARFEFGDALLVFYFVIFVRQWFWGLENAAAWCLTFPLALACWYFYVSTKGEAGERPAASFWLVVALPLLFVYGLRAPFPDSAYDVWSLRLFHGERALRGFIYLPGEFFPTSAPFNPTPDMLTGLFRHLLGYRLGTIVNLLALVWAGTILERLLRPFVRGPRLRALCVLLALFAEHLLFEINNYMPDLLALPLMLEATRLVLDPEEWKRAPGADGSKSTDELKRRRRAVVRVAFLVGAGVALKLSNGALAAPLIAVCAWRVLARGPLKLKALAADALASLLVFAAPLVPFMVWVYRLTGSPIFPIYNGYFRSPFYPPSNGWDGRWGGFGAREILAWPVLIFFEPQRTAEISLYSGRLSAAFVVALACLLLARRVEARTRTLAFTVVLGSLLWSLTMGYIRYGLYLEVLSGVLLVAVAASLFSGDARAAAHAAAHLHSPSAASRWRKALAALVCAVLVAQSFLAARYVSRQEWSMRPTAFQDFGSYLQESKYLLRDRSIRALLSDDERGMFDRVGVWVVSGSKTAGLIPFLNDRAPVVGVRSAGIFVMEASRREFARTLDRFEGRAMYSLALPEDYDEALLALHNAGLREGRVETVVIPFFAPSHLVRLYIFEVTRGRATGETAARED